MTDQNHNPYSTIEGLQQHPLWRQLTDKQRVFVSEFIRTKDGIVAVRTAYDVSEGGASGMASRQLQKPHIRKLIADHFGYQSLGDGQLTKAELADIISTRLRSGTLSDGMFRDMAVWYIRLRGWDVSPAYNSRGKAANVKDATDRKTERVCNDPYELVKLLEQQQGAFDEAAE